MSARRSVARQSAASHRSRVVHERRLVRVGRIIESKYAGECHDEHGGGIAALQARHQLGEAVGLVRTGSELGYPVGLAERQEARISRFDRAVALQRAEEILADDIDVRAARIAGGLMPFVL